MTGAGYPSLPPAGQPDHRLVPAVAVALGLLLTTAVFALLFPNLWYGEHDISDIGIYWGFAKNMAAGLLPYRDFDLEYPPLAAAVFSLPGHTADLGQYTRWFSVTMFVFTLLSVLVTVATAAQLWRDARRLLLAAVGAAAAVAAVGAIIENRFDVVVALVMALAVLLLIRRQYLPAAVVLGIGFALKLTPAAMLPLVLVLAGTRRRALTAIAGFVVAAVVPYIPYLAMAPAGVFRTFTYHMDRPLQIESVLATPLLLGQALGISNVQITTSFGSQGVAGPGSTLLATAATYLTMGAVVAVFALAWHRRADLLYDRRLIVVTTYALVLGLLAFGKVLSPQYMVWLVPLVPLAALSSLSLGISGYAVLLLTHLNFPSRYWGLVYLEDGAILWLAARNVVLLAAFGLAVWKLATMGGARVVAGQEELERDGGRRGQPVPGARTAESVQGGETAQPAPGAGASQPAPGRGPAAGDREPPSADAAQPSRAGVQPPATERRPPEGQWRQSGGVPIPGDR